MSTFVFDIDAALESASSATGDTAAPATVATSERTKAQLSRLSQVSQRDNSSASTLQGLNVTAVATLAARPSPGDLTYGCAAHRPQEAGTS